MRLLIVNMSAAEENNESGKFFKTVFVPLCRRNLDAYRRQDTEMIFRFPRQGIVEPTWASCRYLDHINPESIFPTVIQAEKEGFDAALISCFGSPLKEIRQAVSIPVVNFAEPALLLTIMTNRKFGFVGFSLDRADMLKQGIAEYGLQEQLVGIESTSGSGEGQEAALTDARKSIESFKQAARKLIANGAEAIIPTCGLTGPALRVAPGAQKEYPHGLTEVDGVPIIDLMGTALKMLEMMVELKHKGLTMSNRKIKPAVPVTYNPADFWDC